MSRIVATLTLVCLAAPAAAQERPDTADMARRIDATFTGMGMNFTIPVENEMILGGRFLTSSAGGPSRSSGSIAAPGCTPP